jgi:hypothetical protein
MNYYLFPRGRCVGGKREQMRDIARISFPYRSQTHQMLLQVVAERGLGEAWARSELQFPDLKARANGHA